MRRIRMIMLGIFLTGILLGGIGTGLVLVEFSNVAYAGEKIVGADSIVTKTLDYSFELSDKPIILEEYYWGKTGNINIEENNSLSDGEICYQVSYNADQLEPTLKFYENTVNDATAQGVLRFRTCYTGDDVKTFMEMKDYILKDLKKGQIGSYQVAYIDELKVMMNAETRKHIIIEN